MVPGQFIDALIALLSTGLEGLSRSGVGWVASSYRNRWSRCYKKFAVSADRAQRMPKHGSVQQTTGAFQCVLPEKGVKRVDVVCFVQIGGLKTRVKRENLEK